MTMRNGGAREGAWENSVLNNSRRWSIIKERHAARLRRKGRHTMRFRHTHRPGFWLGFIDFFTAGVFFLFYMPLGGLQAELDAILGRRTMRYAVAYLLGIPTLFVYPLLWMARIAGELKDRAVALGIPGPHTSWMHMFGWNVFGLLLCGPMIATHRFFDTLNKIETELNKRASSEKDREVTP